LAPAISISSRTAANLKSSGLRSAACLFGQPLDPWFLSLEWIDLFYIPINFVGPILRLHDGQMIVIGRPLPHEV
jgi:hypothetical protein